MISPTGVVTTLAGSAQPPEVIVAGPRFNYPAAITTDGTNLYVADSGNNIIRKIAPATLMTPGQITIDKKFAFGPMISTLAGTPGSLGSSDGTGTAASFNYPTGITTDGSNLYVTDNNYDLQGKISGSTIRKIVIATGVVTTLAGTPGTFGSADGIGSAAQFNGPMGITTDGTNLYVADSGNNSIRKIVVATGAVTTLAGSSGVSGSADGIGSAARLSDPFGIATDGTNLYVTDLINCTIRRIVIATGVVTTIAGSPQPMPLPSKSADGTGAGASFYYPEGITTDGTNLYVVDTGNYTIRKIVIATGVVTTIAGSLPAGSSDGIGHAAHFDHPNGITTDGANLYVADRWNSTIRMIQ